MLCRVHKQLVHLETQHCTCPPPQWSGWDLGRVGPTLAEVLQRTGPHRLGWQLFRNQILFFFEFIQITELTNFEFSKHIMRTTHVFFVALLNCPTPQLQLSQRAGGVTNWFPSKWMTSFRHGTERLIDWFRVWQKQRKAIFCVWRRRINYKGSIHSKWRLESDLRACGEGGGFQLETFPQVACLKKLKSKVDKVENDVRCFVLIMWFLHTYSYTHTHIHITGVCDLYALLWQRRLGALRTMSEGQPKTQLAEGVISAWELKTWKPFQ